MTRFRFDKYEGLGNDFVVVERGEPFGAADATRVCDRRFGIGADGVLVVAPPRSAGARATMIVENADGSRPEMCGNGLRCVALHLSRRDSADLSEYVIDTDAGPRRARVERAGDTAVVQIDMGRAERTADLPVTFEGRDYVFRRISMGNPHAIAFDEMPALDVVDRLGALVCARVPGGTNVEFVNALGPRKFDLVVWERGVGRTLACGTGAAATAAALCLAGRAPFGEPLEIRLPGGTLDVSVTEGSLDVRLRGPAHRVFTGETP
jgi:diaminopimelate epimerase